MAKHPRLHRRGGTYYHRASIPKDIRDTYGKTEETFSLGTKDYHEAVRLLRAAAADVDRRFDEHRRSLSYQSQPQTNELTEAEIEHIGKAYYAYRLEEDEESRNEGFGDIAHPGTIELPSDPIEAHAIFAAVAFRKPTFDEYKADVTLADRGNRAAYARRAVDLKSRIMVEEALYTLDFPPLAPDSPSWKPLCTRLQEATVEAYEAIQARNRGDVVPTPEAPNQQEVAAMGELLSTVVELWAAEKARAAWVPKTEREHRTWMKHFVSVAGDRPLSSYSKADGRTFKSILQKLPANWVKQATLADLSISEAADKAATMNLPPMSDTNVNKLLGFVGSFWTWASNNFDDAPANVFQGLKVRLKRDVRNERDPFTANELTAIFSAPVYTGCQSLSRWEATGDVVPRDSGMFWVPIIGLLTGARLGEIVQLHSRDVKERDGVLYLDINDDGDDKGLKNAGSRRLIPVHQNLQQIGFANYVQTRLIEGATRLFPDLQKGADGYYSSPFSKHFKRFLSSIGVKHTKNSFHSFRHCFEDACRDSGIASEIMNALQGHSEKGMAGRYGSGYELSKLSDAMSELRYQNLDLSHLFTEGHDKCRTSMQRAKDPKRPL